MVGVPADSKFVPAVVDVANVSLTRFWQLKVSHYPTQTLSRCADSTLLGSHATRVNDGYRSLS